MCQAMCSAQYYAWSQSTLRPRRKLMLRGVTQLLVEQDFTEIRAQKELNVKLGGKDFKNFRHFTIMLWTSPVFPEL